MPKTVAKCGHVVEVENADNDCVYIPNCCHSCQLELEADCEHDYGMFDVCRKCGYYGGYQPGAR